MITIQQAHANLMAVIYNGKITVNGNALSLRELNALGSSVEKLFNAAKEREETKKEKKDKPNNKPAEDKK